MTWKIRINMRLRHRLIKTNNNRQRRRWQEDRSTHVQFQIFKSNKKKKNLESLFLICRKIKRNIDLTNLDSRQWSQKIPIVGNRNQWQLFNIFSFTSSNRLNFSFKEPFRFFFFSRQGYLFEHEITDEIAPKYHKYIRHPIALDTIRKNLESNHYPSKDYFKKDIYLMLYNAMKYNPRHHHVHKAAKLVFNQILPFFQVKFDVSIWFQLLLLLLFFSVSCHHKKFNLR